MDLSKSFKNFSDPKWLPYVKEFLDQMVLGRFPLLPTNEQADQCVPTL